MPRGQSPFRGDYVVPESKVPEILMAGADAQAKQIEQGFAVAGQAIEQLGLNKKQQETESNKFHNSVNENKLELEARAQRRQEELQVELDRRSRRSEEFGFAFGSPYGDFF